MLLPRRVLGRQAVQKVAICGVTHSWMLFFSRQTWVSNRNNVSSMIDMFQKKRNSARSSSLMLIVSTYWDFHRFDCHVFSHLACGSTFEVFTSHLEPKPPMVEIWNATSKDCCEFALFWDDVSISVCLKIVSPSSEEHVAWRNFGWTSADAASVNLFLASHLLVFY